MSTPPSGPSPNPRPHPPPPQPAFELSDVIAAAQQFGPMLNVPEGIDPVRLMLAIASNESSLGQNCGPRHEPSYDVGGTIYEVNAQQQSLVGQYGSFAASSFGPWQLMFINASGYTPTDLMENLEDNARAFVAFFNNYVMRVRKPTTLSEIGQVYNGGHVFQGNPPMGVQLYVGKLTSAYETVAQLLPSE